MSEGRYSREEFERDQKGQTGDDLARAAVIDTSNKFLVAANMAGVIVMRPPRGPLSRADCVLFAAWLIALAPIAGDEDMNIDAEFARVLSAVRNT